MSPGTTKDKDHFKLIPANQGTALVHPQISLKLRIRHHLVNRKAANRRRPRLTKRWRKLGCWWTVGRCSTLACRTGPADSYPSNAIRASWDPCRSCWSVRELTWGLSFDCERLRAKDIFMDLWTDSCLTQLQSIDKQKETLLQINRNHVQQIWSGLLREISESNPSHHQYIWLYFVVKQSWATCKKRSQGLIFYKHDLL